MRSPPAPAATAVAVSRPIAPAPIMEAPVVAAPATPVVPSAPPQAVDAPSCTPSVKVAEPMVLPWVARPMAIPQSSCRGLTFLLEETRGDLVHVGVGMYNEHANGAYGGDTACSDSLPVLCIRKDGLPQPANVTFDGYHGWSGGQLRTTTPTPGTSLTSRAVADALCASQHGAGYRMAEFHDGGGWHYWGKGPVCGDNFWVAINDQRANPWD